MRSPASLPLCESFEPRLLLSGAPYDIPFTLSEATNVSLIVTDADGAILRELLKGEPMSAGSHVETWDGLDFMGNPVDPGSYTWKLLESDGLTSEFQFTLGSNADSLAYHQWAGDHVPASTVAVDSTGMYVASNFSEDPIAYFKQSMDGTTRYWQQTQWGLGGGHLASSMAIADGYIYMLRLGNTNLITKVWANSGSRGPEWAIPANGTDLSASSDHVVVSWETDGIVRWYNGSGVVLAEKTGIPSPRGVASLSGTQSLVISGTSVYVIDRANTATFTPLITGLTDPQRLDIDPNSGDIFVFDGGASQQIKRYNAAGVLQQTYGQLGGRPTQGLYDATVGFYNVTDIAADGNGGFVITETAAPRRTTHYDISGNVVNEWYGGQCFRPTAYVDEVNPQYVWMNGGYDDLIQMELDWNTGEWQMHATYKYYQVGPGNFGNGGLGGLGDTFRPLYHNGQLYLARTGGLQLFKVDEPGRRLVPVAASWAESGLRNLWVDANGNGIADGGETTSAGDIYGSPRGWWDENFNYYENGPYGSPVIKWSPTGWNAYGTPLYTFAAADTTTWTEMPQELNTSAYQQRGLTVDANGNVYVAINDDSWPSSERYGVTYWTKDLGGNRIVKYDSSGNLVWELGRHNWYAVNPNPGDMNYFAGMYGATEDYIFAHDFDNNTAHVFSSDGLYVGRSMTTITGAPGIDLGWRESNFGGSMYENPVTGDVYILHDSGNCVFVFKLTGWENISRQSGTVVVDQVSPSADRLGTGLTGVYYNNDDFTGPVFTQQDGQINFSWGDQAPTGLDYDSWSARWEGAIEPAYSDTYTFITQVSEQDSVKIWVGGTLVLDNNGVQTQTTGAIDLEAGVNYPIRVEYKDISGEASMRLQWASRTLDRTTVPTEALYPTSELPVVTLETIDGLGAELGSDTGSFLVQRTGDTGAPLTLTYQIQGTATNGADYQTLPTAVEIPAGQSSAVIVVTPIDDTDIEGDETVKLTLTSQLNYQIAWPNADTVNISDDDASLDAGLIGYWKMDETSGLVANDFSGLDNDGTVSGAVWQSGYLGNALRFDGVNDSVQVPYDASMAVSNGLTVAAWVRSDTSTWNASASLMSKRLAYILSPTAGSKEIVFMLYSGGSWNSLAYTPSIDITQWHHYAGSYDGTAMTLYIDGQPVASQPASITINPDTGPLYIGRDDGLPRYFDGSMDDVRLYDRGLGVTEMQELFAYDGDPVVRVEATDATAAEQGSDPGVFTVTRDTNVGELDVQYTVAGSADAGDLATPLSGVVTIPDGQYTAEISVVPFDDPDKEDDETVQVVLSTSENYTIGTPNSATVTILDNDSPPVVTGVTFNDRPGRTISKADGMNTGVTAIEITFDAPVLFSSADVVVQTVTVNAGAETVTGAIAPDSITGSGTAVMSIALADGSALNTWVKVVLNGSTITDTSGNLLDGDAPVGGSGWGYLHDAAVDLPSGDGTPGGSAVFYVASQVGDIDGDADVDLADLAILANNWMMYPMNDPYADLNGTFNVTLTDLGILASQWGQSLGTLPVTSPAPPSAGGLNESLAIASVAESTATETEPGVFDVLARAEVQTVPEDAPTATVATAELLPYEPTESASSPQGGEVTPTIVVEPMLETADTANEALADDLLADPSLPVVSM